MKNSILKQWLRQRGSKEDPMKTRILGILGGIALLMLPGLAKAGSPGRPLSSLAGTFSVTAHGNFGYCLESPSFTVEVSCTNPAAVVFPITAVDVGQGTRDEKGNACTTYQETDSDLTPGTSATTVLYNACEAETTTSYNPTTQSGETSYMFYGSNCKCVGAKYESVGTPAIPLSGTFRFVLSANGTRRDWIITSFNDSVGGFADFAYSGTELQQ